MRVLYCASEVAPIIKVGGLGDVAGSLPKALEKLGVDMSIVVPRYEDISVGGFGEIGGVEVEFDHKKEKVIIWQTILPNSKVMVYLLENKKYLSKDGHQAFRGNEMEIERFAFFSKAIAELISHTRRVSSVRGTPDGCASFDLLHLNDWHTSLVPLFLTTHNPQHIPSLLTIHNLAYQGISGLSLLAKTGLNPDDCKDLKWDCQNRDIDILMEGIIHADFVNTVSPTYAKEIMTSEYGEGIETVLKAKERKVTGILNGIDTGIWNPETDQLISIKYKVSSIKHGKAENKKFLQKELGLEIDENIPLLSYVGRIEPKQKGLDLIYEAMEKLLPDNNFQFILLGTGDKDWEKKYQVLSIKYKANMKFVDRFDERLAHQIYAGADLILVPSKFEPCGLPQMIGMRYGTLPIVRKTGGLADSVRDGVNGFVFEEYSGEVLAKTIKKAINLFGLSVWEKLVKNAMQEDFSWNKSADEYLNLYQKILIL